MENGAENLLGFLGYPFEAIKDMELAYGYVIHVFPLTV